MGSKPWRNLSILFLAGTALVGCNNTSQKDKSVASTSTINSPGAPKVAGSGGAPAPNFPAQAAFPTKPPENTAFPGQAKPPVPTQPFSTTTVPANSPFGGPTLNNTASPGLNGGGNPNLGSTNPSLPSNPSQSFVPASGAGSNPSFPNAPLPITGLPGSPPTSPVPSVSPPSPGFGSDRRTVPSDIAPIQPNFPRP
jgi:hypothetical protein